MKFLADESVDYKMSMARFGVGIEPVKVKGIGALAHALAVKECMCTSQKTLQEVKWDVVDVVCGIGASCR